MSAARLFYEGEGADAGQSYPGLTTLASGLAVTNSGTITSLAGTFGGSEADTTLWLSFIGFRSAPATANTSPSAFNLSLASGTTPDIIGVGGYRGTGTGDYTTTGTLNGGTLDTPDYWALTALDGTVRIGERTAVSAVGVNAGTTSGDFILLKIDYNTAARSDTLSLWINPTLTGGESSLGAAVVQLGSLDLGSFNGLRLYAGANATFNVDEIRLATDFETAIPESSTYGLLLGAGALGVMAWRRRKRA